jgi:hypothetical protein
MRLWVRRWVRFAETRLQRLIEQERKRAQLHIRWIRASEPVASDDRIAHLLVSRWTRVAAIEGGVTGSFGLFGVPANLLLFTYSQLALVVSVAEVYRRPLKNRSGEADILAVLGRAHGLEDLVRSAPRVLGPIAMALGRRYGIQAFGRFIPMVAVPIAARLNESQMDKVGKEAIRRFGNVVPMP